MADEQAQDLDGIVADIYEEDGDFNFDKIHLLSHIGYHGRLIGNIEMYYRELGEASNNTMIRGGYCRSNRKDAFHQILRMYSRLHSFKIQEMNGDVSIQCPIQGVLDKGQYKQQDRSVTKQLSGLAQTEENTWPLNMILGNLPDLLLDY